MAGRVILRRRDDAQANHKSHLAPANGRGLSASVRNVCVYLIANATAPFQFAQFDLLASPLGIGALVIESVYPSIQDATINRLEMRLGVLVPLASPMLLWQLHPRIGVNANDLQPIARIANIACPILVIGGNEDLHTTVAETQWLLDAANKPKQLLLMHGVAHEDLELFNRTGYKRAVVEFLEGYPNRPE